MKASTLEGAAFCLILGLGACADGMADAPGGMAVLLGGVALSGALVHLAHSKAWDRERERDRTEAPESPGSAPAIPAPPWAEKAHGGQKKSRCGGRNTAAAGETKQSRKYFTPLFYRGEGRLSN